MHKKITKNNRIIIFNLLKKGYSIRKISGIINKNPSSVAREIKRNSINVEYDPNLANKKAIDRKKNSKYIGMKIMTDHKLEGYIIEKLKLDWPPTKIASELKRQNNNKNVISPKSIYEYIHFSRGKTLAKYLHSNKR